MNETPQSKNDNTKRQYFADQKTNDAFLSIFGSAETKKAEPQNEIRKVNN